jgi:hypothetical protein
MPEKTSEITRLERVLDGEEDSSIRILPNGEIEPANERSSADTGGRKPVTLRENLGGEY